MDVRRAPQGFGQAYIVYGCPAPFQLRPDLHQAMQRDVQPGHASQFLPLQRAWELTAHNGGMYMNPLRHGHGLSDGPTTIQMMTGQGKFDYVCPCSQMSAVEFAALIQTARINFAVLCL